MASGSIVPQHQRGEPYFGDGNQMKDGPAECKNRQPLGNISNLVTNRGLDAKRQPEICQLEEQVIDIDAADAGNELAVVEYVDELYKFYKLVESESQVHDYMYSQTVIDERMRACLVDWLINVHNRYALEPEILHLTINILDRYLSVENVRRTELQLVGISALLMSSKYERISYPLVNELVCISVGTYTRQQVLMMEKAILGKLEWTLSVPTPYVFLLRYIKASISDEQMENMAHFLTEIGLIYYVSVMISPSMLAASAVFAARCTLEKNPVWDETLRVYTGYSEAQLLNSAKLLAFFHSITASKQYMGIYRKYSVPERGGVALIPPAKSLLAAQGNNISGYKLLPSDCVYGTKTQ